jgi:hypothetical protein
MSLTRVGLQLNCADATHVRATFLTPPGVCLIFHVYMNSGSLAFSSNNYTCTLHARHSGMTAKHM